METVGGGMVVSVKPIYLEPDLIPLKAESVIRRGEGRRYKVSLLERDGKIIVKILDRNTNTPILRDHFLSVDEALEYLRKELGLFVFEAEA
jgi:hypothetical protein